MMKKSWILKFMSYWPPYLGAGVQITHIAADFRSIDVQMQLRFWNRNYVGTHFGGSLYSMVDPFLMLMLIENLGRDYIVWDKAASIRFKKPGRGLVLAKFRLTEEQISQIRADADTQPKTEPSFSIQILNESGETIAEVEKLLYVRRKSPIERSP
jgi:Domain of unknown function (DUF4442)